MIKPEFSRDTLGKYCEASRNKRRNRTGSSHSRNQLSGPSRYPNSLRSPIEHARVHSREQPDARLERRSEVKLTVHSAACNFRNLRPDAGKICELIEHLVLNNGRFHIGHEELLAPALYRLYEHVDLCAANNGSRGPFDRRRVGCIENDIAGLGREPDRRGRCSDGGRDRSNTASKAGPVAGGADQGEHDAHTLPSYLDNCLHHKRARAERDEAFSVLTIAGPTGSGKSALALELAEAYGGTIINADSLQSYRDLPILTAQPTQAAEKRIPHRLYGFLGARERGSAARWRALALDEIASATKAGCLPILVGGTGLYLRALEKGLAPIPEIPQEIRREAVELHRALGGAAFRERLAKLDPVAARRLASGDKQRLVRAFEVVRATGVPISVWHQERNSQPPCRFWMILLAPAREQLYATCNERFIQMIEAGALAEAAALAQRGIDPDLPVMKALGLPELSSHLRGEMSLTAAIAAAQRSTRRYAKRQMTWFRHQASPDLTLSAQFPESLLRPARHFIDTYMLTKGM